MPAVVQRLPILIASLLAWALMPSWGVASNAPGDLVRQRRLPLPTGGGSTNPQLQAEMLQAVQRLLSENLPTDPFSELGEQDLDGLEDAFQEWKQENAIDDDWLSGFGEVTPDLLDSAVRDPMVRAKARRLLEEYSKTRRLPPRRNTEDTTGPTLPSNPNDRASRPRDVGREQQDNSLQSQRLRNAEQTQRHTNAEQTPTAPTPRSQTPPAPNGDSSPRSQVTGPEDANRFSGNPNPQTDSTSGQSTSVRSAGNLEPSASPDRFPISDVERETQDGIEDRPLPGIRDETGASPLRRTDGQTREQERLPLNEAARGTQGPSREELRSLEALLTQLVNERETAVQESLPQAEAVPRGSSSADRSSGSQQVTRRRRSEARPDQIGSNGNSATGQRGAQMRPGSSPREALRNSSRNVAPTPRQAGSREAQNDAGGNMRRESSLPQYADRGSAERTSPSASDSQQARDESTSDLAQFENLFNEDNTGSHFWRGASEEAAGQGTGQDASPETATDWGEYMRQALAGNSAGADAGPSQSARGNDLISDASPDASSGSREGRRGVTRNGRPEGTSNSDVQEQVENLGFGKALANIVRETIDRETGATPGNTSRESVASAQASPVQSNGSSPSSRRGPSVATNRTASRAGESRSQSGGGGSVRANGNGNANSGGFGATASRFWDSIQAGPSQSSAGGSSSSGSGASQWSFQVGFSQWLALLLVAAAITLLVYMKRKIDPAILSRAAEARWAKQLIKRGVNSRDDVVRAYHNLVFRRTRAPFAWWHHRTAEAHLSECVPSLESLIHELTDVYEQARYLPAERELTPAQLESVRTALKHFEAASA